MLHTPWGNVDPSPFTHHSSENHLGYPDLLAATEQAREAQSLKRLEVQLRATSAQ